MNKHAQQRTGRERQAFEILVREHHRRILAFAQSFVFDHHLAEDIVQESFVTAWRQLDRFDHSRDFGAWVRGIVRMKFLEAGRRRTDTPLDPEVLEAVDFCHAEWDRAKTESDTDVFEVVRSCLSRLPDTLKAVVRFFYFERMSCQAMARKWQLTEPTVRQRLHRGREGMQACIEQRLAEAAAL